MGNRRARAMRVLRFDHLGSAPRLTTLAQAPPCSSPGARSSLTVLISRTSIRQRAITAAATLIVLYVRFALKLRAPVSTCVYIALGFRDVLHSSWETRTRHRARGHPAAA